MAGNIKYIEPKQNYKKVSKSIIYDQEVDALTLGIYTKVISMGASWNLNVKGLSSVLKISPDKVRKAFSILEKRGYLRRTRSQGDEGRYIGWDYEFSSTSLTDIAKSPMSDNTDDDEKPALVLSNDVNNPTSENGLILNKDDKSKKEEDIIEIETEMETMSKTLISFPFPQPFLLSSNEWDWAGNDPAKIVTIKRHHLQKNLAVIEGEVAMDANQSKSFLDYWCSCDNNHPERIRAESDKFFNLKQRAESWMKKEKEDGRTNTQQQTIIEQYADRDKKYNELINTIYGNKNNTGSENSAVNSPDEQ